MLDIVMPLLSGRDEGRHTSGVCGVLARTLELAAVGLRAVQEFYWTDRKRIRRAVGFSRMIISPPQHERGRRSCCLRRRGSRGMACANNRRETTMDALARGAQRKPKRRMRTKPRGNTCSRNRPKNSSPSCHCAPLVDGSVVLPLELRGTAAWQMGLNLVSAKSEDGARRYFMQG